MAKYNWCNKKDEKSQLDRTERQQAAPLDRNVGHIVIAGEVPSCKFDPKSNEADDGCDPHETLQPPSQLPGKLHILWCPFRRLQLIWTVSFQDLLRKGRGQTLGRKKTKHD